MAMRGTRAVLVVVVAVVAASGVAGAGAPAGFDNRGIRVVLKADESRGAADAGSVRLYGASHALVIGNDRYTGGWPRLSNTVRDAEAVAAELTARGFEVTLHTDLESRALKAAFEEFFVVKGADPEARLFVWYAGHGHTLGGEGYLVPTDAPRPDDATRFKLAALNMRRFGEYVRQAVSRHAFAVFDSCFAGTVFDSQRALPPAAITRATTLPVRQFLTSGDADQEVSDDGSFRELFLRALRGEERADANRDGYLTASEIGLFLADRVTNLTVSRQTPRYGKLRDKDYDRGDFVFTALAGSGDESGAGAKSGAGAAAAPSADTRAVAMPRLDADALFWSSVKDSGRAADFQAYLDQFPDGTFAALARNRVAALEAGPPAGAAPPPPPAPASPPPPRAGEDADGDGPPSVVVVVEDGPEHSAPRDQRYARLVSDRLAESLRAEGLEAAVAPPDAVEPAGRRAFFDDRTLVDHARDHGGVDAVLVLTLAADIRTTDRGQTIRPRARARLLSVEDGRHLGEFEVETPRPIVAPKECDRECVSRKLAQRLPALVRKLTDDTLAALESEAGPGAGAGSRDRRLGEKRPRSRLGDR